MNILIVGSGKGSWSVRGLQLGAALGARVTMTPTEDDFRWADRVVLVKHAGEKWAPTAHRYDLPIVWDALDCWRQPTDNHVPETQARAILQARIDAIQPALTIGATEAMAAACGGVCLPHHAWAGLVPTPARAVVSIVAYEGSPRYLGQWAPAIDRECARRGWRFVINPEDVRAADLIVAFRDGPWDGWICREWKSGVKVVNAIAAGRPLITQASAAVRELQPMGSIVVRPADLAQAFDAWASADARADVAARCAPRASLYTLDAIATRYRAILAGVSEQVPAC